MLNLNWSQKYSNTIFLKPQSLVLCCVYYLFCCNFRLLANDICILLMKQCLINQKFQNMKNIILLLLIIIGFSSCKNNKENTSNKNSAIETSVIEVGCYAYNENNSKIVFEITNVENGVLGNLTYELKEKDRNSGTFSGEINGENLIGIYTFMSEGIESKREVAFLIKENQLIEGYGEMKEDGTTFLDKSKIIYTSTMSLTKTDCALLKPDCLFKNGKSHSNLRQTCVTLSELKTKLNPLKDGEMTSGNPAFILFDESQSKAELFLPNANDGLVLEKTSEGNWQNGDYYLISWKGYVIKYKGQAIFGGE